MCWRQNDVARAKNRDIRANNNTIYIHIEIHEPIIIIIDKTKWTSRTCSDENHAHQWTGDEIIYCFKSSQLMIFFMCFLHWRIFSVYTTMIFYACVRVCESVVKVQLNNFYAFAGLLLNGLLRMSYYIAVAFMCVYSPLSPLTRSLQPVFFVIQIQNTSHV